VQGTLFADEGSNCEYECLQGGHVRWGGDVFVKQFIVLEEDAVERSDLDEYPPSSLPDEFKQGGLPHKQNWNSP
jgi:hypothetical protein